MEMRVCGLGVEGRGWEVVDPIQKFALRVFVGSVGSFLYSNNKKLVDR